MYVNRKQARAAVEKVRPGCIWLAESVETEFVRYNRQQGVLCHSDAEMYEAFDICYDYDVYGDFLRYLKGEQPLDAYVSALLRQEGIYPADYVKLRYLENHDRPRAAFLIPDEKTRKNWLAFMFLQKGTALIYDGQEFGPAHRPGLFDADPIALGGQAPLADYIGRLASIKKELVPPEGAYDLKALPNDWISLEYAQEGKRLLGFFSLKGKDGLLPVVLPEGSCENLLDGKPVMVEEGLISSRGEPVLLKI